MISRQAFGRALALCDAAKLRLPILEESLARGLASFHAGAAKTASNELGAHPVAFSRTQCTDLAHRANNEKVTSLIQRRQSSSEEAFREYGRAFGDGSTPVGGPEQPDEGYGEASYPEGLFEEEHMDDEEQHESKDEREMRQQLLKAALPHVVRTMPSLMTLFDVAGDTKSLHDQAEPDTQYCICRRSMAGLWLRCKPGPATWASPDQPQAWCPMEQQAWSR